MLAFTCVCEVGVDIEEVRALKYLNKIAEETFSTFEIDKIEALKGDKQLDLFFDIWTRKEAFLKALGCGFSKDPKRSQVNLSPHFSPILIGGKISSWHTKSIPCYKNYKATIGVENRNIETSIHTW